MFSSTAASYKFFWLLALLKRAPDGDRLTVQALVIEMVAIAWAPGALYRLSFGPHDRLQDLVRDLQADTHLPSSASEAKVKRALIASARSRKRIEALGRYVPSRFLAPWHDDDLTPSLRDDKRTKALVLRSQMREDGDLAGPYTILDAGPEVEIRFDPHWRAWLLDNLAVVQGFAEMELARSLQARNPHVPGIVNKLRPPGLRNLAAARRSFERLRSTPEGLADLYTGDPLAQDFVVDHFLPRAFVAHDLLWNLAPVGSSTNRSKADQLPDPKFISAMARFHHRLIQASPEGHRDLEDYAAAFGVDVATLRVESHSGFQDRLSALLAPLLDIATHQGFRSGWRPA